jgi:hypothetical protein
MAKTRAEIQFKTSSILVGGIVGDAPSAEDAETIDGYIDGQVAELNSDGTIYIDDPDALPDDCSRRSVIWWRTPRRMSSAASLTKSADVPQSPAGDCQANAGIWAATGRVF